MKKIFIYVFFAAIALLSNFNSAFAFWDEFEQSILSSNFKYLYSNHTKKNHNKNQSKEIISVLYKDTLVIDSATPKSKTILDVYLTPKTMEHYVTVKNIKPKDIEEPKDKKHWVELKDVSPRDTEKLTCFITEEFNKDGTPIFAKNWKHSYFKYTFNKGSA